VRVKGAASVAPSAETGAERWLSIQDDLLRSLAHTISNRLATVSGVASLLEGGTVPDARMLDGLRQDAERLERVLDRLRQLPRRPDAAPEPMLLADGLEAALQLVAEHPLLQGRTVGRVVVGEVLPVRAEPQSVVHAACVALLAAARRGPGALVVSLETVADRVHLTVHRDGSPDADTAVPEGETAPAPPADAPVLAWLLAASYGHALAVPHGCGFSLPTLAAVRRRGG
jgi:signal transduction histidine kinase